MKKLYFIGVVFEEKLDRKIKRLKEDAREKFDSARALRSPAHITLVPPFHYDEENIPALKQALGTVEVNSLRLGLYGAGVFGKRVIFVKTDNHKALRACKEELDKKLEGFDIATKVKRFHPHITIAFKDLKEEMFEPAYKYFRDRCNIGVAKHCRLVVLENERSGWKVLD